jgi:hypothetical protein
MAARKMWKNTISLVLELLERQSLRQMKACQTLNMYKLRKQDLAAILDFKMAAQNVMSPEKRS